MAIIDSELDKLEEELNARKADNAQLEQPATFTITADESSSGNGGGVNLGVEANLPQVEINNNNGTVSANIAPAESFVAQPISQQQQQIDPTLDMGSNAFSNAMEQVEVALLVDAGKDEKFVKQVQENIKDTAVKHTEVEQAKAELKEQAVQYQSELLDTKQQANQHQQAENKWANKEKSREFHYNGVKPIMMFVGIEHPMCLFLLYFLTFILTPFYLLAKLWKGTIGALIAGAEDENRPKAAKGFLWTVLGVLAACLVAALIYLFLKWQGIVGGGV